MIFFFSSLSLFMNLNAASKPVELLSKQEKMCYVLNKYEHKMHGKESLYFPAKNAKRLVIIFAAVKKHVYNMWSWFWKDDENWKNTAYLFLKDDDTTWYLGNNKQSFVEDYCKIITSFIDTSRVPKDHVFTFGGSMGGYAALFYATILELGGAVIYNPQVNKKCNNIGSRPRYGIEKAENRWQDLDEVVKKQKKMPRISLVFGSYPHDQCAAYDLIETVKTKTDSLFVMRHITLPNHVIKLTKDFIEKEIAYLDQPAPKIEAI